MRFQDLFHSPPGVLFAFPSRYWFTIGRSGVFSLGGWSPHIQTGFHVPRLTHHHDCGPFAYRAVTVYGRPFQAVRLSDGLVTLLLPALQPRKWLDSRFGLFPVRSPLLGESLLISFPAGTEMFQFPAFASPSLCIQYAIPFGGFPHSEISGSKLICQLPEAYRRLSRPSSPIIAKASTTCTCSLDPITGVSRSCLRMNRSHRYRLSIRVAPYSKSNLSIPLFIH